MPMICIDQKKIIHKHRGHRGGELLGVGGISGGNGRSEQEQRDSLDMSRDCRLEGKQAFRKPCINYNN